jgi:hypothetical protein
MLKRSVAMLKVNRRMIYLFFTLLICIALIAPASALAANNSALTGPQPTQISFEGGETDGWVADSSSGLPVISDSQVNFGTMTHSGNWSAWLGGVYNDVSFLEKTFTVPVSHTKLTFWRWIISEDACGGDKFTLLINGSPVDSLVLCAAVDSVDWQQYTFDLSLYAGQTVTVRLQVETDSSYHSSLFVDDISLVQGFKLFLPLVR